MNNETPHTNIANRFIYGLLLSFVIAGTLVCFFAPVLDSFFDAMDSTMTYYQSIVVEALHDITVQIYLTLIIEAVICVVLIISLMKYFFKQIKEAE